MPPLRRKRKSRTSAPSVVYFGQAKNEAGQSQLAVWAECTYAGVRVGPIWSHTAAAVTRVLATLSGKCQCGRKYHRGMFFEGRRVVTKSSP